MKKYFQQFKRLSLNRRKEIFLLVLILLIAAFFRLDRIAGYMTFLGDEGRDAIALRRIIVDHKFRLIGPVTSIGNMYLGPLYYYLVTPAMFLSGLSPVGPSVMVALLSVVTTALIWWLADEWFGSRVGLVAAWLYAISPTVIVYSHSSWNPNVMPFFALVTMIGLWRLWQKKQFFWLPIMGVTLSFAVQSHYLGLLLFPVVGLFWFITLINLWKNQKGQLKKFLRYSGGLVIIFSLLTILPLVWFDLRHGFINFNAFKEFFTVRQTTINLKPYKALPKFWLLTKQIFTRLLTAKNEVLGTITAGLILGCLAVFLFQEKKKQSWRKLFQKRAALILILVWFLVGLFGLGNYKQHIYDHYFGFVFPVPFLLAGWFLTHLERWGKIGRVAAITILILLTFFALAESPLRTPPNNQLKRTEEIARFVMEKAEGRPFNLALIAERNYDDAYAFFLQNWQAPLVKIEPLQAEETITDQLFVICEKLPCEPVGHAKAEIAMFGWTEIDKKWERSGIEIYKLVRYRGAK